MGVCQEMEIFLLDRKLRKIGFHSIEFRQNFQGSEILYCDS